MSPIEIFENLLTPLKESLTETEWEFLMSRGEIFISQYIRTKPIKELKYTLLSNVMEIGKTNPNLIPSEIPEIKKILSAIDVIDQYIEKE
jgi:hypothetical protein